MKVDRLVLDTNVLISALLSRHGKPRAVLTWALTHATLLTSADAISELETRIERPRLAKLVDEPIRRGFVHNIRTTATLVQTVGAINACRDPDDDKILEIAVTGSADCIVTGNQDLLVLDPFRNIPILSPAQFLDAVR